MDLNSVRTENLARLSAIMSELSKGGKRNRFNEVDDLVSVSVKGLSLNEDNNKSMGTKHISITGTKMFDEEVEKVNTNKDNTQNNGDKKKVLRKAKTIQIAYLGAADSLNPATKEMILEFVYRWKLEHAFKNVNKNIETIKRFI